jgi:hypothetical protein
MPSAIGCGIARTSAGTLGRNRIFFTRSVLVAEDLIHREAAFGGELIEANAFVRMLPEMFARCFHRLPVFRAERFVGRVHHHFKQLEDGRDLIGAELLD